MTTPATVQLTAVRFGWIFAEVRGRNWKDGPRPAATPLPPTPTGALPLRAERSPEDARRQAAGTLMALAHEVGFEGADEFVATLPTVLPPFDESGATLLSTHSPDAVAAWDKVADFFVSWDSHIQDDLTRRDDLMANGYLLGRGLSEIYWGLGRPEHWLVGGVDTAVSPAFLLGPDRRQELARMLGRLGPHLGNPMTVPAIAGSLEAWGAVVADPAWRASPEFERTLYGQGHRWYQLLVLQQDPTTLVRPYSRLSGSRHVARALATLWPQVLLGLLAVGLITTFLAVTGGSAPEWVKSVLATGGIGTLVAAGAVARAKNAAQQLAVRLRQDVYTDLVAVDVSLVPPYPSADHALAQRRARLAVQAAVRGRTLTTPTASPDMPT